MFWVLPLAGAALGALADNKKPLRGAAIGAGVGATGGLLGGAAAGGAAAGGAAGGAGISAAPGLAGGAATGGMGAGGTLGEFAAGLSAHPIAPAAAQTPGLLSQASPYIKDANNVLGAASSAKNLGAQQQQQAPSAGLGSRQPVILGQNGLTANQRRQRGLLG